MSNLGQIHFKEEQVVKLMAMQDELNTYIHPQWKEQGFDWNFAIIDECREIKEHLGWKWWKENYQRGLTEANRKQVQLEVIDILHFVLSNSLEDLDTVEDVTSWLNGNKSFKQETLEAAIWQMLGQCIDHLVMLHEAWHELARHAGLTTEQVIETYTQKYVLNKFRQDHGYKDGSYVKNWHVAPPIYGDATEIILEDNEVLEQLISSGMPVDEDLLYGALQSVYDRAAEIRKHR